MKSPGSQNAKVKVYFDRDKLAAGMRQKMIGGFKRNFNEVKDWYSRFIGVYMLARLVSIVCLAWSTIASYKFFEGNISWFEDPAGNQFMAFMITVAQSFAIGFLTKKVLRDLFTGMWDLITSVLGCITALLIVWNAATDWIGVPELAKGMTTPPSDTRTPVTDATYTRQLEAATANVKEAKDRRAYITGACRNEDCYVEGGKAYWMGSLTEFGKKAIRTADADIKKAEAEVARINQAWEKSRSGAQAEYQADLSEYKEKVLRKTQGLQGLNAALLLFYVLAELFQVYFGARAALDEEDAVPSSTPQSGPQSAISSPPIYQNGHTHPSGVGGAKVQP